MKLDLHLHTTASDGTLGPGALAELLAEHGFTHFAVTDHDTLAGLPEAARVAGVLGITMIPGVELSTGGGAELHILGYGITRPDCVEQALSAMRTQRMRRLEAMISRLSDAGVPLGIDELNLTKDTAPSRVHIARALVKKGVVTGTAEAFKRYLSPGRPGYVPREKVGAKAAIALIREGGGIAVLAHPGVSLATDALPSCVRELMAHGLVGLEVYHPRHSAAQIRQFDATARREGLLVTGGSDYHGPPGPPHPGDGMSLWGQKKQDCFLFLHRIGMTH